MSDDLTHSEPPGDEIARLGLLADPVRRRTYELVAAAVEPVDRDTCAAGLGISRSLAAFHLDRLVAGGLLEATFRRRSGRSGPGAGRPAKFYRRAPGSVEISLPPRRYGVAAEVFAAGLERTSDGEAAVAAAAGDAGRAAAASVPALVREGSRAIARRALACLLDDRGFEPRETAGGAIELRNCPFRDLTADHRDVTCGANFALLDGLAGSFRGAGVHAVRRDPPEPCCVTLVAGDARDTGGDRRASAGG